MSTQRSKKDFRAKEVLCSAPMRKGEELRFSVVEVDGKARADIRYFSEIGDGMWPTPRGITIDPEKLSDIEYGVKKLVERFTKKK